jgi:pyrroline-5-carboxylate reductase
VIRSLAEAGVKSFTRDIATELAAQTVIGAGSMVLETSNSEAKGYGDDSRMHNRRFWNWRKVVCA